MIFSVATLFGIEFFIDQIKFSDATYQMENQEPVPFTMPLSGKGESEFVTVEFDMHLPYIFPKEFRIVPDDCIEVLVINGRTVHDDRIPYCPHYNIGEVYDLHTYIHSGKNHIQVVVKDVLGDVGLKVLPEYEKSWPVFAAKAPLYLLSLFAITIILP